jgi:hypothetical protein
METAMRFIITARPAPETSHSSGEERPFDEKVFSAYMKFNEDMFAAGVLIASEGLNPASRAAHVVVSNGKRIARDGPFAETKELVGGFYLIEVGSLEEAIEWATRCPIGSPADEVLEIRQLTGAGDIPPELMTLIRAAAPAWSASLTKSR